MTLVYEAKRDAMATARDLANRYTRPMFVIRLRRGFTIYDSTDPAFDVHRPASYLIVQPDNAPLAHMPEPRRSRMLAERGSVPRGDNDPEG